MQGTPFAEELAAFLDERARAVLDELHMREDEEGDRAEELRLYLVPTETVLDMHESGRGLQAFQDLYRAKRLELQRYKKTGERGRQQKKRSLQLLIFIRLTITINPPLPTNRSTEQSTDQSIDQDVLCGVLRKMHKVLAVSYAWQGVGDPDSTGERLKAVHAFLGDHPEIEYVWWDFMCVPQNTNERVNGEVGKPARAYPTTHKKNQYHDRYFLSMISGGGVNLVYLGAYVLSVANALYMQRFWTQFEYYLSIQGITEVGFSPNRQRSFVRCIQSLSDSTRAAQEVRSSRGVLTRGEEEEEEEERGGQKQ